MLSPGLAAGTGDRFDAHQGIAVIHGHPRADFLAPVVDVEFDLQEPTRQFGVVGGPVGQFRREFVGQYLDRDGLAVGLVPDGLLDRGRETRRALGADRRPRELVVERPELDPRLETRGLCVRRFHTRRWSARE